MTYASPGNLTGLADMFSYVANTSDGLFPLLVIIVMFLIAFISVKIGGLETSKSFAFSSFMTFFLSSILWAAGIVPGRYIVILLVMIVISFIWMYVAKD